MKKGFTPEQRKFPRGTAIDTLNSELVNTGRRQLIERIASSASLQKSERLKDLLRYLAEKSLRGDTHGMDEHRIGVEVFGKPETYSIVEDSSVRVHVRQLRLKLHEYFDGEGRDERQVVEIPKGSYAVLFRTVERPESARTPSTESQKWRQIVPWSLALLFLVTTFAAWLHKSAPAPAPVAGPPWPLANLLDGNHSVSIVLADANYGIKRLLEGRSSTLAEYLSPSFWDVEPRGAEPNSHMPALRLYLSRSILTSYADVAIVVSLMRLADGAQGLLTIRAAKNLHPRDFQDGSFILVGSPTANPWVDMFQNKLNFHEIVVPGKPDSPCFANEHPAAGELARYCAQTFAGGTGETFATISLLPVPDGHGNVLILQGLHQEGTEATGDFLSDASKRLQLQKALGLSGTPKEPVYFEALIRIEAIAGAPSTTSIVDARVLHP